MVDYTKPYPGGFRNKGEVGSATPVTKAVLNNFQDGIAAVAGVASDLEDLTTTGRLSETALSAAFADAIDNDVPPIVASKATELAQTEDNEFGQFLSTRLLGAAPRSLAMSGPLRYGRGTRLIAPAGASFGAAATPLPNLYWPQVTDVRGMGVTFGGVAADWVMVYSTDHQGGTAAGCAIAYLPAGADPLTGTWVHYGRIIDITNGGTSMETPRLYYAEQIGKWICFAQTSAVYEQSAQHTMIFQANSLDAGLVGWTLVARIVLNTDDAGKFPANGHTGYTNPFRIGNGWYAYGLLGGTDFSMNGFYWSSDGLDWEVDPRPLGTDSHYSPRAGDAYDSVRQVGLSTGSFAFRYGGQNFAVVKGNGISSGTTVNQFGTFLATLSGDLRSIVAAPSRITVVPQAWMGATTEPDILSCFEYAGNLYVPFVADSGSKIGIGRIEF